MKSRIKRSLMWLYALLLTYLTVDIVLRRWLWDQVPTQVTAPLVYGVIVANIMVLSSFFAPRLRRAARARARWNISGLASARRQVVRTESN